MKVTRRKAEALAKAYVTIHNEAAKEYKAAFARIGARMWQFDYCHAYKSPEDEMDRLVDMWTLLKVNFRADFIRKANGRLPHPLTVLDSWRHLPRFETKREALREEISKIHSKYQRKWRKVLRSVLSTTR